MTVDAKCSTAITARDAGTIPNAFQDGSQLREAVGYIEPTAAAEADSVYRFAQVPSCARITYLKISHAAFTTGGAMDIGVYRTTHDGGAVVDADFFASAYDANASGAATDSNLLNESTTNTAAYQEKQLWEVLGVSEWTTDPGVMLDIAATVTTAFDGGKPMLMRVGYVL